MSVQRRGCERDRDFLPTYSIGAANQEDGRQRVLQQGQRIFPTGPVFIQQRGEMDKVPVTPRFARPAGIKEALRCSLNM